jgi:hypothetical protein
MADLSLWNIGNGYQIGILVERSPIEIALPVANGYSNIELEIISGSLPLGTRIQGTKIVGTPFEVALDTVYTAVIRAYWEGHYDDRTLKFIVTGADAPQWLTAPGLLPVGGNNTYFILDNELIDFQLLATDNDLPAGDNLEYFIADGDGTLPPGITLTTDGRLTGIVEPILSLDKRFQGGQYDTMPYGDFPFDYAVLSGNGYGTFYYDSQVFDFFEATQSLRKINRYFPFAVTVTDGDTFQRREFKIYVVGDDFLRADNTVMRSSTGVFTADTTHVRTPVWVTPRDLGYKRANNYVTLYLDIVDNDTLTGEVIYTFEDVNDDGSISELPPGLSLDSRSGEITGIIPYQPAITQNYKFTVKATRFEGALESATIFANFYEDTLIGTNVFKVYKIDLTGNADNVLDLQELRGRKILLNRREYTVTNVDDRNAAYDLIYVNDTIGPNISLIMSRTALIGQDYMFVNRLNEQQLEKYQGRELRFSETEVYSIQDILPYIEYEIIQTTPSNDPIRPRAVPRNIDLYENYFAGDLAIYTTVSGGDGKIYRCVTAHNIQPQTDGDGNIITDGDGNPQIIFETLKWTEVAETINDLTSSDLLDATKQALEAEFGGVAYIEVISESRWKIKLLSTAITRIISTIRDFFALNTDSTQIQVRLLRDNEHRISFDTNLSRQLNAGRNIGIALFKNDFFSKNIVLTSTDETVIPSKSKTFEINIIGEIDSNISWITDTYLGKINANFTSTLKVEATTTVPDTKMLYFLVEGKLPYGMRLNYYGEIVGHARQYPEPGKPGLTTFDSKATTWDGSFPGITSFDRQYKFTVEAKDRFNLVAVRREFILDVEDLDNTLYTDIYATPYMKQEQRDQYRNFISTPEIFKTENIYRPDDESFGIQKKLKMLVYAGIEAKQVQHFVSASAKNHKRNRYALGEVKKAIAREPGTLNTIYEVIYVEVVDRAKPKTGKTRKDFSIKSKNKITVDSIIYPAVDDSTSTNVGYNQLPVYGRNTISFLFPSDDKIIINTRDGDIVLDVDNNDFFVELVDTNDVQVTLQVGDSEPMRRRPTYANTIKSDSNAVKVSDSNDVRKYISSIDNMRRNIKEVGKNERNYLPLWMRTPQAGFQELDYVSAIPIVYCKSGLGDEILLNIKKSGFDFKDLDFEIDRYIVQRTDGINQEQYILFANYQFNV